MPSFRTLNRSDVQSFLATITCACCVCAWLDAKDTFISMYQQQGLRGSEPGLILDDGPLAEVGSLGLFDRGLLFAWLAEQHSTLLDQEEAIPDITRTEEHAALWEVDHFESVCQQLLLVLHGKEEGLRALT